MREKMKLNIRSVPFARRFQPAQFHSVLNRTAAHYLLAGSPRMGTGGGGADLAPDWRVSLSRETSCAVLDPDSAFVAGFWC